MWLTLEDHVRKLTGATRTASLAARTLRGRVWLSRLLHLTGLSAAEFGREYVHKDRTNTNLVFKWRNGDAVPGRQSAERLDRALPGSLAFYDLPLFELLEDRPMSRARVQTLLSPYRDWSKEEDLWRFPNDDEMRRLRTYVVSLVAWDSNTLFQRGDFWGFQAIVGLVRLAEAIGQQDYHLVCAQDMFRALPVVLREPWFAEHSELLIACIEAIQWRYEYSGRVFDVNYDVILEQTKDPYHEPNLLAQLRRQPKVQPISCADPILPGRIVSGTDVARRAKTRVKSTRS